MYTRLRRPQLFKGLDRNGYDGLDVTGYLRVKLDLVGYRWRREVLPIYPT